MSTTPIFINEEMEETDPDILLTPGTGESWWFKEVTVGCADGGNGLDLEVEYVSDSSTVCSFGLDDDGVNNSPSHKHFISRYQQSANLQFVLRALPDLCVPDGCRIRLIEAVNAGDYVFIHAMGVVVDSANEVAHAELWQNTDPQTILQPASNAMIQWEIWWVACSAGGGELDIELRRQTTNEIVLSIDDYLDSDAASVNFSYGALKQQNGVTAVPGGEMPFILPDGYEILIDEGIGSGDDAAILFVGRSYDAT